MSEENNDRPRVLGSNLDRDRAVDQMRKDLDRQKPAEQFDFWSLVPAEAVRDQLPSSASFDVEKARIERHRRLDQSGILPTMLDEDVDMIVRDEFPQRTDALKNVQSWHNKRSTFSYSFSTLVIIGDRGQGKTVSGGWLIGEHGPGVYCTAEALRASFKGYTHAERELWRRAQRAVVLVVDELGRETDVPSADAMMFELVNMRRGRAGQRHQLWTLLLGNLSEAVFRSRYDQVTIDKIEQAGAIVTAKTPNLRVRVVDRVKEARDARERARRLPLPKEEP